MEKKTARQIQNELAAPFAPEDLEWRVQVAYEDSGRGIAVPYVTNRAIQNRLDEVVGADRWYNDYKPWHSAGKKESQICGISIYFEDRGFVTKWDGAEDSDIEPVKGGLSDSMKRAAVQWGIGRVLYNMDTVYVDIERKGKSFIIKPSERAKLDKAYMDMLSKLRLEAVKPSGVQSMLIPKNETPNPENKVISLEEARKAAEPVKKTEFRILEVREQRSPQGMNTSLLVVDGKGRENLAFVRGTHPELKPGALLYNVEKTFMQQDSVVYYRLDSFEVATGNAA